MYKLMIKLTLSAIEIARYEICKSCEISARASSDLGTVQYNDCAKISTTVHY